MLAKTAESRYQVYSVIEMVIGQLQQEPSSELLAHLYFCEVSANILLTIDTEEETKDYAVSDSMIKSLHVSVFSKMSEEMTQLAVEKGLAIARMSFESMDPGSKTSSRCAAAVVSMIWSIIPSKIVTPNIIIGIQSIYRAMCETNLDLGGLRAAAMLPLQLHAEIYKVIHGSKSSTIFAESPIRQVMACLYILSSLWECLSLSSRHTDIESLKPAGLETISCGFELNTFGMTVFQETSQADKVFLSTVEDDYISAFSNVLMKSKDDCTSLLCGALGNYDVDTEWKKLIHAPVQGILSSPSSLALLCDVLSNAESEYSSTCMKLPDLESAKEYDKASLGNKTPDTSMEKILHRIESLRT